MLRGSANGNGWTMAGRALITSARRVDNAMASSQTSSQARNAWASIRGQLSALDPNYR
jgi:hypothetical protein